MIRRRRSLTTALVAAAGAAAVLSSSAMATPDRPPGISDAAWEDLQGQIARGEIDTDVLADRIAIQERAASIFSTIAADHPDTYALSELRPDATARIYFTGVVPVDVAATLAAEPGITAHGGATYSAPTADAVGVAVHMALFEHVSADASISTVVDPVSGEVSVEVSTSEAADAINERLASRSLDLDDELLGSATVDETAVAASVTVAVGTSSEDYFQPDPATHVPTDRDRSDVEAD